jgi:predicted enzyme related to lactoylglutathione lyase
VEKSNSVEINSIGQVAIVVKGLDRAVDFYRHKLGLPFLFRASNMAFFDCGGIRLMLSEPEDENARGENSILYFRVGDIEGAFQALVDRGVEFLARPHKITKMEDHDLWMAFFEDSEGNTMALMSEVS